MGFAENIKRLREEHHLTQAQLGDIAGVSNKAISTWENGTAYPRIGAIERIAAYYHLLKSDLVDDRDVNLSEVIDKIRRLDDADLARLSERIDTMLEDQKYVDREKTK